MISSFLKVFVFIIAACFYFDAQAATFYVKNLDDEVFPTKPESLRAALEGVTASIDATNQIIFQVAGTILIQSQLPGIGHQVTIDGTQLSGYSKGNPKITIDCNNMTNNTACFHFGYNTSAGFLTRGSVVKGVKIINFSTSPGVFIADDPNYTGSIVSLTVKDNVFINNLCGVECVDAKNFKIQGNSIICDFKGPTTVDNGIHIWGTSPFGSANAIIGGTVAGELNFIKGYSNGVEVWDVNGVQIRNNSIIVNNKPTNYSSSNAIYLGKIGSQPHGNDAKPAPVIFVIFPTTTGTNAVICGTAQSEDLIEIFESSGPQNADRYIGITAASTTGAWSYTVDLSTAKNFTATATTYTYGSIYQTSPLCTFAEYEKMKPFITLNNSCGGTSAYLSVNITATGMQYTWKKFISGQFQSVGTSSTLSNPGPGIYNCTIVVNGNTYTTAAITVN